jgi:hypothetical protein
VRRLAQNAVGFVSITQELGNDPMSNTIRRIMAPSDEYQSKTVRVRLRRFDKLQPEIGVINFVPKWRALKRFELLTSKFVGRLRRC